MKLQDIIVTAVLVYVTMLVFSYFWTPHGVSDSITVRPGQELTVRRTDQLCHPVQTEIDFFDEHRHATPHTTQVQGYNADLLFSSAGGVLENFIFKRDLAGVEGTIATLLPPTEGEREKGPFLIALNEMTPFDFSLMEKREESDSVHLIYQSTTAQAKITKEFIVSLHNYTLDLVVTLEPLQPNVPLKPRIFLPGPIMKELGQEEKIAGVVYTAKEALEKLAPEKTVDIAWAAPKIFGVEDRYFVYALIGDKDHFTQRAFFKRSEQHQLTAIFEGPEIQTTTTWHLSFYCGPKEVRELTTVDPRLEALMDYGWLAFISKPILMLLIFIYGYVGNYGWAIIILTILMRLVLLPFTRSGERKMKRGGADYAQKLKYIEHKYKNEPEKLAKEKEILARQQLSSLTGCLPLLLQIPVFIGLSFALRNAIELYRAPFILWIKDLSARDPYYVIPACLGLTVFLAMSSQSKDPRHTFALFLGALVVTGLMANISAGLGLCLTLSGFLGVVQTRALKKIA